MPNIFLNLLITLGYVDISNDSSTPLFLFLASYKYALVWIKKQVHYIFGINNIAFYIVVLYIFFSKL